MRSLDLLAEDIIILGQLKYLVVAIDYFTKWIKAKPLPTITIEKVRKFVWKRIIYKYGVPHHLVSDNITQFTDQRFEDFFTELKMVELFSFMEHPQTNGIAEAANKIIIAGLKKRLE